MNEHVTAIPFRDLHLSSTADSAEEVVPHIYPVVSALVRGPHLTRHVTPNSLTAMTVHQGFISSVSSIFREHDDAEKLF